MFSWAREYRQSIKARESEDKIDLLFYRPIGFVLAKVAWALGLTPTHLTLLGMFIGLLSGFLFSHGRNSNTLAGAVLLFLLSGIFDSADGQLARLSHQSTPFGLVLDGLCDNIVFLAVYIGCAVPLLQDYGWWIWVIAISAGLCHSLQSATLDFYSREFLYYTGARSNEHYWNPILDEARDALTNCSSIMERVSWRLRYSWLFQQQLMSTRSHEERLALRKAAQENPKFGKLYRKHNQDLLHLWRPLGANIHTIGIITFALLGKFDLYLVVVDITLLNLWMLFAWWMQRRSDRLFFAEIFAV